MGKVTELENGDDVFEVTKYPGHFVRVAWSERGETRHENGWDLAPLPLYLDDKRFDTYWMAVNSESGNDVLQGSHMLAEIYLREKATDEETAT